MNRDKNYQLEFLKKHGTNEQFQQIVQELDNLHSTSQIDKSEYHDRLKTWIYKQINSPKVLNIGCEIIIKDFFVEILQSILSEFPIECYVSAGTSNQYDYFLNPLVQIYNWKECAHHRNFEEDLFTKKFFENIEKTNKGILTINRKTQIRDYIHKKIKNFDGFYNYVSESNNFLPWQEHSRISKKSFVHFIIETDCNNFAIQSNNNFGNHLTEKTILPILEESIIVVLGGHEFIKSLNDLGFYVWNNDFGFNSADKNFKDDYRKTLNSFVDCINYYNSLTFDEIKSIYKKDKDKILNNKSLITDVIY